MTWGHRGVLFALGVAMSVVLVVMGGLVWQPSAAKCPGCAIVSNTVSCPGPSQVVQGGHVCES